MALTIRDLWDSSPVGATTNAITGSSGGDLWADITGQTAADTAAAQMAAATTQAAGVQQQYLDWLQGQSEFAQQQWQTQQEALAPYQEAGLAALSQYQNILQNPDALANDPTLQFMQQQGQEQVESSAAARGMQLSGRTLEDLSRTGQGIASQYRGQILGELSNLMGMGAQTGLSVTQGMTGTGAQYAGSMGQGYGSLADLYQQQGMTAAAATMGAYQGTSNILSGALGLLGGAR